MITLTELRLKIATLIAPRGFDLTLGYSRISFKGIYFGDTMRDAFKVYPALLSESLIFTVTDKGVVKITPQFNGHEAGESGTDIGGIPASVVLTFVTAGEDDIHHLLTHASGNLFWSLDDESKRILGGAIFFRAASYLESERYRALRNKIIARYGSPDQRAYSGLTPTEETGIVPCEECYWSIAASGGSISLKERDNVDPRVCSFEMMGGSHPAFAKRHPLDL